MIEQLKARLTDLREEFANGEKKLAELNEQSAQVRNTMLRISGAIQVLEEELTKAEGGQPGTEESLKAAAG